MKNFWKKNATKTLEEFLIECIHEGTDFCFSFKEIPNPDFIKRFRSQYENEFNKLQSLAKFDSKTEGAMSDDEDASMMTKSTPASKSVGKLSAGS